MTPADLKALVRTIPDFPKKGIQFRDITTLLGNGRGFAASVEWLADEVRGAEAIAGLTAQLNATRAAMDTCSRFVAGGSAAGSIASSRRAASVRTRFLRRGDQPKRRPGSPSACRLHRQRSTGPCARG